MAKKKSDIKIRKKGQHDDPKPHLPTSPADQPPTLPADRQRKSLVSSITEKRRKEIETTHQQFKKKVAWGGVGIGFLLLTFLIIFFVSDSSSSISPTPDVLSDEKEILDEFGMPDGKWNRKIEVLLKPTSLGDLLTEKRLTRPKNIATYQTLARNAGLDILKSNHRYIVYTDPERSRNYKRLIYEADKLNFWVVNLTDDAWVKHHIRPVDTLTKEVSLLIITDVWDLMKDMNEKGKYHPKLISKVIEEAFPGVVDFHYLKPGDRFKIIYKELRTHDEYLDIYSIEAVFAEIESKPYYSFPYTHNGQRAWYDLLGRPQNKRFLLSPVKSGQITSGFGPRWHPILKQNRIHRGTDYAAPMGTPIYAVGAGKVLKAQLARLEGNYVRIQHDAVYETFYLHMSAFASHIKPGVRVKKGELIGYVGKTGQATGPHVCLHFKRNGKQFDHRKEMKEVKEPAIPTTDTTFSQLCDSLIIRLTKISD